MKRLIQAPRQQLVLTLQRESMHPLPEEKHEELVAALAALLLEALGKEVNEPDGGHRDELEDNG